MSDRYCATCHARTPHSSATGKPLPHKAANGLRCGGLPDQIAKAFRGDPAPTTSPVWRLYGSRGELVAEMSGTAPPAVITWVPPLDVLVETEKTEIRVFSRLGLQNEDGETFIRYQEGRLEEPGAPEIGALVNTREDREIATIEGLAQAVVD